MEVGLDSTFYFTGFIFTDHVFMIENSYESSPAEGKSQLLRAQTCLTRNFLVLLNRSVDPRRVEPRVPRAKQVEPRSLGRRAAPEVLAGECPPRQGAPRQEADAQVEAGLREVALVGPLDQAVVVLDRDRSGHSERRSGSAVRHDTERRLVGEAPGSDLTGITMTMTWRNEALVYSCFA